MGYSFRKNYCLPTFHAQYNLIILWSGEILIDITKGNEIRYFS